MQQVTVEVENDHLERLASASPILALAELVWNAVDADAKHVCISVDRNSLGGIDSIRIEDDGHGIPHNKALEVFGRLGGSWKKDKQRSQGEARILHGKDGEGRFKAFGLGNHVRWCTCYRNNGHIAEFTIEGRRPRLRNFKISDPATPAKANIGTVVEVSDLVRDFTTFDDANAVALELAVRFALYLREYPAVEITFDTIPVDHRDVEDNFAEYALPAIEFEDGSRHDVRLSVIEWTVPCHRSLYYCDADGFAVTKRPPGIQEPGFTFTAYVKSSAVPELEEQAAFAFESGHPDVDRLYDCAKLGLKKHFRARRAELAQTLVQEWKEQEVYPYEGEPQTLVERSERQVFEVVAKNVHDYVPGFDDSDVRSKRFSLRLLRQAIETSPSAVQKILREVLELPQDKVEDLADLLEHTSLSAIINASKLVADRLDFLLGLELLLYDARSREQLLERAQLQKILEEHTWLFGEQYSLSVADQSLTQVLAKHLKTLGRGNEPDHPEEVLRPDGRKGIVDLMFSRLIPQPRTEQREHLVVEIKRPNQKINATIIDQVRSYALAVAEDERFRDTETKWVFWVVANDFVRDARRLLKQRDRPFGLVHDDEDVNLKIWAIPWSSIIESCRTRMQFYKERLEYSADDETALALLKKLHGKYLPPVFSDSVQDAQD